MVVRFITRRYIGEYDPTLEKVYAFHTVIDNEMVYFDILDTAGHTDVICIYFFRICQPCQPAVLYSIFTDNIEYLTFTAKTA
ncbi:Ras family [Popillia japonica]|uniref:small monomeric GTPase n=1 Tax=Popillia japonica TaxID=7064 RepID=A0AAW1IF44_POPJA